MCQARTWSAIGRAFCWWKRQGRLFYEFAGPKCSTFSIQSHANPYQRSFLWYLTALLSNLWSKKLFLLSSGTLLPSLIHKDVRYCQPLHFLLFLCVPSSVVYQYGTLRLKNYSLLAKHSGFWFSICLNQGRFVSIQCDEVCVWVLIVWCWLHRRQSWRLGKVRCSKWVVDVWRPRWCGSQASLLKCNNP